MRRALFLLLCALALPVGAWGELPIATESFSGTVLLGNKCTVPTGTPTIPATYDDTGVAAALIAAASATDKIVRFDANYTINTSTITIPDGVSIYSTSGATITSSSNNNSIYLGNNSRIVGLKFTGTRPIRFKSATAISGSTIECNDFYDVTGQAIYDNSTADNTFHSALKILWNKFLRNSYSMWLTRPTGITVCDNYLGDSTNRNIEAHGARLSTFCRNRIKGGITGIEFLSDSQYGRFGAIFGGNDVFGNYLTGISEEGIGFDINGDGAANIAVLDQFTVCTAVTCSGTGATSGSATSNPRILVLCASCSGMISNGVSGYTVTFLTGAAGIVGKSFVLTSMANSVPASAGTTVYLQLMTATFVDDNVITSAEFAAIAGGEVVVVGHNAIHNRVHANYFSDVGTPIACFGMCYQNYFYANVILNLRPWAFPYLNSAILMRSLCGLVASSKFAGSNTTTSVMCGIADYNSVFNNDTDQNITVGGKSYASSGNTVALGSSTHHLLANNIGTINNEAWWNSANNGFYGSALNDPTQIKNNNAYAGAGFSGGLTPGTPAGFVLSQASASIHSGVTIGPYHDFRGCRYDPGSPSVGALEQCAGDWAGTRSLSVSLTQAASRTPAGAR